MEVLTRNIISGRVKFRQGIVDIVGRVYENQWKMIQIIHRFFTSTNCLFSFNEKLYLFWVITWSWILVKTRTLEICF